jgi:ammonium transporter, Amt family
MIDPLFFPGACSLIVGWYGFNAGSAYGANHLAGFAILNTQISWSDTYF